MNDDIANHADVWLLYCGYCIASVDVIRPPDSHVIVVIAVISVAAADDDDE